MATGRIINAEKVNLTCTACGCKWSADLRADGKLPRAAFDCPEGCGTDPGKPRCKQCNGEVSWAVNLLAKYDPPFQRWLIVWRKNQYEKGDLVETGGYKYGDDPGIQGIYCKDCGFLPWTDDDDDGDPENPDEAISGAVQIETDSVYLDYPTCTREDEAEAAKAKLDISTEA
jgi:hypothetical protein